MARSFTSSDKYQSATGTGVNVRAISCWVRPGGTISSSVQRWVTTTSEGYVLRHEGSGVIRFYVKGTLGGDAASSAGQLTANTWDHFVGQANDGGPNTEIYKNGSNIASSTFTDGTPTPTDFSISNVTTESWDGALAEVGIWSSFLTPGEIIALAKGVSPLLVRPDKLAWYAPLLGSGGRELVEYRSGLTLTATGSPTFADHPAATYRRKTKTVFVPSSPPPTSTATIWLLKA